MKYLYLLFVGIVLSSSVQARAVHTPPLIQAVQSERMSWLVQLVNGGRDVNVVNAMGRTCSALCCIKG